jgi:hypothetical protein
MGTMLVETTRGPLAPAPLPVLLTTLWRDPHTVAPEDLAQIIQRLEQACAEHPESADFRTCLGIAHAMNHDAYKSMDALEEARRVDPASFWAQFKFAELLYRLRALPRAEQQTLEALELATDGREMAVARKQLQEIRRLMREGTQKPAWTKPLNRPAVYLFLAVVAGSVVAALR